MNEYKEYEHDEIKEFNRNQEDYPGAAQGGMPKEDKANIKQTLPDHKITISEQELQKHERIRATERNFNEEFMVDLWHEYHFKGTKKYNGLYFDLK